jgi:triple functional domain protein
MEPMNPIPVSNSDKLGLPSGSNSTGVDPSGDPTPSSPGGLNKPNDSCDSVDATTTDNNAFSNDAVPAGSSGAAVITADSVEKAIQERSYRLQELLDSERIYVSDLAHCCQYIQYMRESKDKEDHEIPMPEDLREGKDRMIFGNIEAIYEWHRDNFLKNLESCIDKPIELGLLFKKYDRKFQMYVVYCQNKPKSEYIVSEYIDTYFEEIRLKLGFKLRLTDLLIKPIQRLTKYHMLLEAIVKYSQRAGCTEEAEALSKAFHVMTVVPNQANDMMDIGRLQGFEGKITAQGKLLHRGPLVALDNFDTKNKEKDTKPIMKPFTCFLFEQIMIFSETVGKKTQFTSPVYVYKAHFLVNKMALDEKTNEDPLQFLIKSNDPARDELKILCQAESEESRKKWLGILKRQLQTQMDFLRALQAPIAYHNRLAND